MHKILRAESRPAVSTGHDCQGSPSLSCQVLSKVSLLNDPLRYGGGLARFAAALLLIAFALPLIPAAEAQTGIGPILFSEDYESYEVGSLPEGYEIVFNGLGTAEQRVEAEGGNRHLRTAGRYRWGLGMHKDFDFDLPGVVSVSWRMRVDNDLDRLDAHFGSFGLKNTDEATASISIHKYESDRKIVAHCPEGGGSRPELQLGVWTEFRMDVDFTAGRYSMYKDGVKFCERATGMADLSARWNIWGESSGLHFSSGNSGSGASVTLFDDIVVRGGRPPSILFSEDYESYEVGSLPEGYEIVFNGLGTAEQRVEAEGGNRHLRTAGRYRWGLGMHKDFDFDLPGVVSVSWRMRVDNDLDQLDAHFGSFGLKNTDEATASISIHKYESDRKIVAHCPEGGGSRPELQLGVWTEFRMDVDFTAGRYSMYKDGVKFCERATGMADLSARWNIWGESSGLHFSSGNSGSGASVTLFDDIVVRGGRPPSILALASYGRFHVIAHELSEAQDHDAECRLQLGGGFRLADWNDIVTYYENGGSLTDFTAGLRMSVEGRDRLPGEISDGYRISRNGEPLWSGNRHYFFARHEHQRPSYFLAHANIDNYRLSLGSWYGTGGHALCYGESAETVPMIPGGSEWFSISAVTPYSLTVEWKEPENTGSAITDYDVRYREVGSGGDFIDAQHEGTARTATLTGLSPGTAYEVQVRATNATGTGPWSQLGEVRTNPLQTGDHIYYFPHLAVGASWQTTITYINYSTQEVSCQTEFLSDQGTPLLVSFADRGTVVSRSDVLPPGGSVHQETNVGLTLAPGWARTTCSGPVTASLLFRQYNSAGVPVAEAGVNATRVAATRFVTFAEQGVGKAGAGVAYANPSATAALVTFTAKDAGGQVLARANRKLLAGGHDAQNMVSLFGLPSFSGSLEITSTEPIVSLSLNFEAAPVFSSLPPGEVDAAAQGTTTYYFPHLAVGASWQTTITYINYSPQQVSCTTDFISDHGSPLLVSFADRGTVVSRTDVLPAGWSVHQETNVGLTLAPGWARATCSGPVKASLLFRQHNSAGLPVAEAGVNATRVAATRFVTFAEQGEGKSGTGVAYANPSATAAHVTFTARDTEGQVLASVVRTLLPEGHDAQNMASLFGLPSFSGSLEITSTEPIVSLSLNFEAAPVFSSLPPGETPSGGALAPTSQAAFNSLFVGKVMVFEVLTANVPNAPEEFRISFLSAVRARVAGSPYDWTYVYVSTGLNTGTATARTTLSGGRGVVVIMQLTFTTTTTGTVMYSDNDARLLTGNFSIIDP